MLTPKMFLTQKLEAVFSRLRRNSSQRGPKSQRKNQKMPPSPEVNSQRNKKNKKNVKKKLTVFFRCAGPVSSCLSFGCFVSSRPLSSRLISFRLLSLIQEAGRELWILDQYGKTLSVVPTICLTSKTFLTPKPFLTSKLF